MAGLLLALNGAQAAVDTGSLRYRMPIIFSGYTGTETLNNFPALVVLSNGLSNFSFSQFKSPSGGDLRFTDAGKTAWLNYEIDTWKPGSKTPEQVAGLELWLRADAGVMTNDSGSVTNWLDQSASGNNASQTDPAKQPTAAIFGAGQLCPVVKFANANQYLTFDSAITATDKTLFIIYRSLDASGNYSPLDSKASVNFKMRLCTPDWWSSAGKFSALNFSFSDSTGVHGLWGSNIQVANWFLQAVQLKQGDYRFWANGQRGNSDGWGGDPVNASTDIFGDFTDVGNITGEIAEVLVFNRVLSDEERTEMGAYLSSKYNIWGGSATPYPAHVPAAASVWVQVPALASNTTIYAYWGGNDTNAPASVTNGATWDSGYVGVWHGLSATDAGLLPDSTAALRQGTNVSSKIQRALGPIGESLYFNDGAAKLTVPVSALTTQITVSFWQYGQVPMNDWPWQYSGVPAGNGIFNVLGSSARVFGASNGNQDWWPAIVQWCDINFGSDWSTPNIFRGQWVHWAFTKDTVTQRQRIFVNGTPVVDDSQGWFDTTPMTAVDAIDFGAFTGFRQYYGRFDEIRVSNVAQSPDWIKASYMNQGSNVVFSTYGAAQRLVYGTVIGVQ